MSKLVIGTENGFLDEIPAISLDSQFGSTISQAINVINNNFKKLISVPFLRGEQGENVNAESLKIQDGGELTPLGKRIVETIYNISDYNAFDDDLDSAFGQGMEIYNTNSWKTITENPNNQEIVFYKRKITDNDGEKLELVSQQIYIFIDDRVRNLETVWNSVKEAKDANQYQNKYFNYDLTTFVDLSCALTITGTVNINSEDGTKDEDSYVFNIVKHNVIPTLYYDGGTGGVNEWCWKINGTTTKISAQGLKGEDGTNARSVVCKGNVQSVNGNSYKIGIQEVLSPGNTQITDLNEGDLAIVWYLVNGNLNCAFGSIENDSGVPCIYLGQFPMNSDEYINADLMTILNNVSLRDKMNDICNTESTPTATNPSIYSPRGLWVPDKYRETVVGDESVPGSPDNVHMFWSENTGNKKAHMSYVSYSDTAGDATPSQEHTNTPNNTSLDIHYDILNKDFITLGRKMNCPSYAYKKSDIEVNESGDGTDSPNIVTETISKSNEEITQYINIKESDTSVKMNSLNSKGLYIIGDSSDGLKNENQTVLFSKTDHKLINSHSIITNTPINITGSNTNSYFICPLTDVENALKFKASQKIHINNEDVLISKGSVVIGENKALSNALNSYIQFKGNASIYNYDYFDVIKTYNNNFNAIYVSPYRPRKINYVPVSIGGWLSMYNSKTRNSNGSFIVNKSETIELTPEQNFKHAFLSGKFGWTGVIENDGLTSDNVSQMYYDSFNRVSKFSQYVLKDGEDSNSVRYGVTTSMSGFWTKIGNIIDVKGKIMFCGTKFKFEKDANNNKGSLTVINTYPLSYSALYDFLINNSDSVKFPLPVVLKRSNDFYISTGNVFENHTSLFNSITLNGVTDAHTSQQTKNKIISTGVSFNSILNGNAKFHFFGNGTIPTHKDYANGGTVSLNFGGIQLVNPDTIESLPNIFSCDANLKVIGDKDWGFLAIPKYENIDSGRDSSTSGKYENYAGPIRFSDAKPATTNTRSDTHMYNIVRPEFLYEQKDNDNANDTPASNAYSISNYKKLFLTTTIAPYIVRYVTFQFSYSLDDDIYGATTSKLINGLNGSNNLSKEGNYDSESYGFSTIEHAIDYEEHSEFQIPTMDNGEYITTGAGLVNINDGTVIGNNSITDYLNTVNTSQNLDNQNDHSIFTTVNTNNTSKTIYWGANKQGNTINLQIGENPINSECTWSDSKSITTNSNILYNVVKLAWTKVQGDYHFYSVTDVLLFNTENEADNYINENNNSQSVTLCKNSFNLGNSNINTIQSINLSNYIPD